MIAIILLITLVQLHIISSKVSDSQSLLSNSTNYPWSKYSRDILKQSYRNYRGRVYYAVFGGRSKFLKIHLQYCDMLLRLHLVTEVHIWDFNLKENDNSDYINKYTRDTASEGYRLFDIPTYSCEENPHELTMNYLYRSFYEHYAYNKRYRDTDILIKADDDIVYMDLSYFARYINDISSYPGTHLHFPNIINNDAGFIVQSMWIPHNNLFKNWTDYYTNDLRMNLTDRLASTTTIDSIQPATGWENGLHTKSDFAYSIHQLFLSNPKEFIDPMHHHSSATNGGAATTGSHQSSYIIANRLVFSNMYAARMSSIRKHFDKFLHHFCCNFDTFIGILPSNYSDPNIIHVDFVVAHFAYDAQYDANNVLFDKLAILYDEVAMKFTKNMT